MSEKQSKASLQAILKAESDIALVKDFIRNANDASIRGAMDQFVKSNPSGEVLLEVEKTYKKYNSITKKKEVNITFNAGGGDLLFNIGTNFYTKDKALSQAEKDKALKDLLKWSYANMMERVHGVTITVPDQSIGQEFKALRQGQPFRNKEKEIISAVAEKTIEDVKAAEKEIKLERKATKSGKSLRDITSTRIDILPHDSRAEQIIITRKFLLESSKIGLDTAYRNAQAKIGLIEKHSEKLRLAGFKKESDRLHYTAVNLGGAITKYFRESKPMEYKPEQKPTLSQAASRLFYISLGSTVTKASQLLKTAYGDLSNKEYNYSSERFIESSIRKEASELNSGIYSASSSTFELNYDRTQEIVSELNVYFEKQRVDQAQYAADKPRKNSRQARQDNSMEINFTEPVRQNEFEHTKPRVNSRKAEQDLTKAPILKIKPNSKMKLDITRNPNMLIATPGGNQGPSAMELEIDQ